MKHSLLQRTTAGLLAGIFLLAGTADVYGLHDCPHHEHGGDETARTADAPSTHQGAHATSGTSDRDEPTGVPCTCVGSCHGSAATPVVSGGPESPTTDLPSAVRSLAAPAHPTPGTDPTSYLLPYPNGPPLIG